MLNPIRDKPPVSAYPTIDRITGVLCAGILLGCLLACLGPGEGGEAHYISNEADKPIAVAAAYRRPVETGRIEELIEYHNPTPLSDELFRAVDAAWEQEFREGANADGIYRRRKRMESEGNANDLQD